MRPVLQTAQPPPTKDDEERCDPDAQTQTPALNRRWCRVNHFCRAHSHQYKVGLVTELSKFVCTYVGSNM